MSNTTTFTWNLLPILGDEIFQSVMSTGTIVVIISTLAILNYYLIPKFSSWRRRTESIPPLPPGPYGLPVVGSLPFLESQLHHHYTKLAGTYGPIFKLRLGKKLCVVISSLPLVKEVTRDQDTTFAHKELTIAGSVWSEGGNDVAFSAYNSNWRKLRKIMVGQMLSNPALDACYALRREEIRKVVRLVYGQKGKPVNLSDLAFLTVVNANLSTVWGDTLKGEEGYKLGLEFKETMKKLLIQLGKPNISEYFPWLARFDLQGIETETKKVCHWFDKFVNTVLDQRRMQAKKNIDGGSHDGSKDLLQFLIDLKESDDESISWTQVKTLLVESLVGGTDTVATSIQWIMTELLNHPEMMIKVQQELIEVVGPNNNLEESHVFQLPYLEAVIMETLRLHPPAAFPFPREPSSDAIVGGYLIPKGTRVIINIWAMHRDPIYWEDPLEFRPERFLNNNGDGKHDFTGISLQFLPFGSGRRTCPGISFAQRMTRLTVASFVHSFDWKLPEGIDKLDTKEHFSAVLCKREPVIVIPSLRLSNLQLYEM